MDELAAVGFAAGCFPRLGAGLGAGLATVGASSFVGIHFSSEMSRVKYTFKEHFERSEECNGLAQRRYE